MKKFIEKIKSKKAISDLVTILIITVIAGAVTYAASTKVGTAAKNGGDTAATQITNAITDAGTYAGK